MKTYLCSIGEKTTSICKWQLERFGYEVIMLDEKEPWLDKYKKFLSLAKEDCLRIDADIIPNKNIEVFNNKDLFLTKAYVYDFYKNNIWPISPVYYSKEVLDYFKDKEIKDLNRPETYLWRLINKKTNVIDKVVGIHGFFQEKIDMIRGLNNKIDRGQLDDENIDLIRKFIYEDIY